MKYSIVKTITRNAIVAAIYFLLTYISSPFAFVGIQVRIAEFLVLLCFFRRDYVFGITLGCLIANLFSPLMPWDLLIGTAATFISCLAISFCRHLALATLIPVVVNAFMVAGEITVILNDPFWLNVGLVAAGEFISVSLLGYGLFMLLKRHQYFLTIIGANRMLEVKW